jgi:hypothetical protein
MKKIRGVLQLFGDGFKRYTLVVLACLILVAGISSVAYPQGAVTLVQIILGGTPISGSNPLPVSGTFSASLSGFPTAQTTGTPIAVTTGGVTGNLPAGTVVVASNVGSTNGAYCKLGASATVNDQLIPTNSWFAFTVGASTQLTCITSTSTTTVNMVGGSGLPTGSGGGGGGTVFGPTAVGSANANPPVVIGGTATGAAGQNVEGVAVKPASTTPAVTDLSLVVGSADGNIVTAGTKADVPCTLPASATACSLVAVEKAIANAVSGPVPLGSASGGWTPVTKTAITNSSVTIKASAGQLGYAQCDNNNAAWTYVQFFDATSPVLGTTVNILMLPPNLSAGLVIPLVGLQFSNSIKVAATTTPTGSTAPATNTINCAFGYN